MGKSSKSHVEQRFAPRLPARPATSSAAVGQGADDIERVRGIGGPFFRAKDPKKLAEWNEANLGIITVPKDYRAG